MKERRLALLRERASRWRLLPGPQTLAAESEAFEVLYGGQAGGGKSELVTWLARYRHRSALILRRTFPELNRTLIPRSLQRYGDAKFYNSTEHAWKWPDGRRVEFGYLDNEKHVYNYQGAEIDGFFPDELTQFPKEWYLYIFSRIRTTHAGQRCRVVATSNPGGEYEAWVKQRWAPWLDRMHPDFPAASGEIRWFLATSAGEEHEVLGPEPETVDGRLVFRRRRGDPVAAELDADGEPFRPTSRTFIRAGLKDNPYLANDREYRQRLNLLPEPWRSQLMDGDWSAGSKDHERQVIPTAWIEAAMARWTPDRPKVPLTALGIDVARGGKDRTIFAPVYENWCAPLVAFPGSDTPDGFVIAADVATLDTRGHVIGPGTVLKPDVVGAGASPTDILIRNGYNVTPMNGGAGTKARDRSGYLGFANKRAQWYWQFREALDPQSGDGIALPPDQELKAELAAPRWEERTGKIKIEDKDEIKERLGRSPDKADAVVNAFARGGSNQIEALRLLAAETENNQTDGKA